MDHRKALVDPFWWIHNGQQSKLQVQFSTDLLALVDQIFASSTEQSASSTGELLSSPAADTVANGVWDGSLESAAFPAKRPAGAAKRSYDDFAASAIPAEQGHDQVPASALLYDEFTTSNSKAERDRDHVSLVATYEMDAAAKQDADHNAVLKPVAGSKRSFDELATYETTLQELDALLRQSDCEIKNQPIVSANHSGSDVSVEDSREAVCSVNSSDDADRARFQDYLDRVTKGKFSTLVGECCLYCPERVFWRRHDLIRHIKTSHLMERPFECSVCTNRFKRKSHLEIHVRAVHEQTASYECPYCQKIYTSDSTRRKHIRTLHHTNAYEKI